MKSISTIEEYEVENFLQSFPELQEFFNKQFTSSIQLIRKICSTEKYEKHYNYLENLYQKENLKKIDLMISSLLRFSLLATFLVSLILLALNIPICYLLTGENEKTRSIFKNLLMFYSIVIFFDWMCHVYTEINKSLTNTNNIITTIRGIFGLIIFIPLGFILNVIFKYENYGYWFGLYMYFLMFLIVSYLYFKNQDLKMELEALRKRYYNRKTRLTDEIEDYYKN